MAKEPHSFSLLPSVPLCGELRNEAPLKQGAAVCSTASQSPCRQGPLQRPWGFIRCTQKFPPEWRRRGRASRSRGLTITANLSQEEEDSSSLCLCRRPEEGGDTCEAFSPGRS